MSVFDPDDLRTLRPWLHRSRLPFWLAAHPRSGRRVLRESRRARAAPVASQRRTTLVQARLTYVFSHAYLLSGDPAFGEAARHGLAFLMRAARAPDGGWFRAVSVDGATLDNTRDAYDHAFVLFALAWYFRATGDASAIQLADATWQFMQQRLADPRHGGFFEEFAPGRTEMKLPRRQNPHMHLLEALLALHVATGEKNWLRRAGALVDLFKRRFVDPRDRRADRVFRRGLVAGAGRRRQPARARPPVRMGVAAARVSTALSARRERHRLTPSGCSRSARQFGIERGDGLHGAVFDGVDAHGALVAGTKLLWPQTEYIKACVARAEWLERRCGARRDPGASRADRAALHAPGRRQLAQSARARRHAARADDARARAVSSVHGGRGGGSAVAPRRSRADPYSVTSPASAFW